MEFFETTTNILRKFGIWYDEKTNLLKTLVFFSGNFTIGVIFIVLEFSALFILTDYLESAKTVGGAAFHSICAAKIINTLRHQKNIQEALNLLKAKIVENDGISEIVECRRQAKRYSFYILNGFFAATCGSILFSHGNASIQILLQNVTANVDFIPYNQYHFMDTNIKRNAFIEAILQGYILLYLSLSFITADSFFLGMMLHLTAEVKVIGCLISEINLNNKNEETMRRKLQNCIDKTVEVLKIHDLLEKSCNSMLFMQHTLVTIMICTIIINVPNQTQVMEIIAYIIYALAAASQPFIVGLVCQGFTEELIALSNRLYMINWDEGSTTFRKTLIFAIARMQKPVITTIGKFTAADTRAYLNIMKTTYSFYTLLSRTGNRKH